MADTEENEDGLARVVVVLQQRDSVFGFEALLYQRALRYPLANMLGYVRFEYLRETIDCDLERAFEIHVSDICFGFSWF